MKLDLDLCRDIMIAIEDDPVASASNMIKLDFPDRKPEEVSYHVMQLVDGGYVVAHDQTTTRGGGALNWIPVRLTWEGHKFVAETRDKGTWEKVKEAATKHGIPLTMEAMKQAAGFIAAQAIKGLTGA